MSSASFQKGSGLVEIVVGAAVVGVAFVAILSSFTVFTKASLGDTPKIQAALYAAEGIEAVRFLRDSGFTANVANKVAGTAYYLTWNSGWSLGTVPVTDDGFTRTIVFSNVNRDDTTKDIVSSGGTPDGNTRLVTVSVTWSGALSPVVNAAYLTNIFNN